MKVKRIGATLGVGFALLLTAACQPPATAPSASHPEYGCGPALAYLATHAAPGYVSYCLHDAGPGHAAITCRNAPPTCPAHSTVIYIAVPCQASYLNEAANSNWLATHPQSGSIPADVIDPYGPCNGLPGIGWWPPGTVLP
jgi:hypothetical protein